MQDLGDQLDLHKTRVSSLACLYFMHVNFMDTLTALLVGNTCTHRTGLPSSPTESHTETSCVRVNAWQVSLDGELQDVAVEAEVIEYTPQPDG